MSNLHKWVRAMEDAWADTKVVKLGPVLGRWEGYELWRVPSQTTSWDYMVAIRHDSHRLLSWSCSCLHGLTGQICHHVRVATCESYLSLARNMASDEADALDLEEHEYEEHVYKRLGKWVGSGIERARARIEGGLL